MPDGAAPTRKRRQRHFNAAKMLPPQFILSVFYQSVNCHVLILSGNMPDMIVATAANILPQTRSVLMQAAQPVIATVVHKLGGREALGTDVFSEADLARAVHNRFRLKVLRHVVRAGFSPQEIERFVIPARTLSSSKNQEGAVDHRGIRPRREAHSHSGLGGGCIRRRAEGQPVASRKLGSSRWKVAARTCSDRTPVRD